MLEELSISSLGVIDHASVEFGPGFNVVTGETGAGKTMVVTALGLLLGARADSALVRKAADRARVEGRVRVSHDGNLETRALELGADLDDDSLIVARTVSAEGRSRASVGGAGVPASALASLAAELVAVHGQSEQLQLLAPARQRAALDAFGGPDCLEALADYRERFDRLRGLESDLADRVDRAKERRQEADLLRFGLAEVEAGAPQPGEDAALVAEEERLAHVDGLRRAADDARAALSADEPGMDAADALGLVAAARKALDAESAHDPRLAGLAEQLAAASYALTDVAADIASYASDLDTDPSRLAWVQERRAVLGGLSKKYGDTVDDVIAWSETAARRLVELDDDESRVDELRRERDACSESLVEAGRQLTASRRSAAGLLSARVTSELHGLAMPHATFGIDLASTSEPTRDGMDEVTFCLAAHQGAEPRPLQRGASGGELSRVMLALEVCLAGTQPVPTMVFDEVDAGVGGKAAVEVGRRLARLAASAQVIVVTHLPQVAAFADHHFVVVKSDDGSVTTSGLSALDESGRRTELSRMLAGLEGSASALAHADELVELAQAERHT